MLHEKKKKNKTEIMQHFQSKLIMYHELINYLKLLQIMQFLHTVGHFTFFYQVWEQESHFNAVQHTVGM